MYRSFQISCTDLYCTEDILTKISDTCKWSKNWHPPVLLNTFVHEQVTGQHESLAAHSPDVMITAKTERAFLGKGICEKHFVLSSVVKNCEREDAQGRARGLSLALNIIPSMEGVRWLLMNTQPFTTFEFFRSHSAFLSKKSKPKLDNSTKLHQGMFSLDIRKHVFAEKVVHTLEQAS